MAHALSILSCTFLNENKMSVNLEQFTLQVTIGISSLNFEYLGLFWKKHESMPGYNGSSTKLDLLVHSLQTRRWLGICPRGGLRWLRGAYSSPRGRRWRALGVAPHRQRPDLITSSLFRYGLSDRSAPVRIFYPENFFLKSLLYCPSVEHVYTLKKYYFQIIVAYWWCNHVFMDEDITKHRCLENASPPIPLKDPVQWCKCSAVNKTNMHLSIQRRKRWLWEQVGLLATYGQLMASYGRRITAFRTIFDHPPNHSAASCVSVRIMLLCSRALTKAIFCQKKLDQFSCWCCWINA